MSSADESDETGVSRREFVATAVGTTVGIGSISSVASADHVDATPSYIDDPVFESSLLEEYKPQLLTHDLEVEPSSIHGFVVRSDDKDTTALVYWTEYPVQIDRSGFASHIGDHEPYYRFLRYEGTADEYVERDIYSAYHWMAGETGESPDKVYVFPQYHHYSIRKGRGSDRPADDIELKDLTSSLPRWLDDDEFHDALSEDFNSRGSPAYNPWIMLDKPSWWRVSGLSNFEEGLRRAWLFLGVRGSEGTDIA